MSETTVLDQSVKNTKSKVLANVQGYKLLGEVVTWDTGAGPHALSDVCKALEDAGLPKGSSKELEPRYAFNRAIKKMESDKAIELVDDTNDTLTFQLTSKELVKNTSVEPEMVYSKKGYLHLNKDTGKISCKIPEIQDLAQKLLDLAATTKTGSDVSALARRLFTTANIDLFPLRDRGGVYFVFSNHKDFVDKVHKFLKALGGHVNRLPVPEGEHPTVTDIVARKLKEVVDEHLEAVNTLTIHTADVSLKAIASRIQESRTKVEAYASHLSTKKEELEEALQEAQDLLTKKIEELGEQKKNTPPEELGIDKWGYKADSDAAKLNACITDVPKTSKVLAQEAGLAKERQSHLRELVTKGFVEKTVAGYFLKENTK